MQRSLAVAAVALLLSGAVSASGVANPVLNFDLIDEINAQAHSWVAGPNEFFRGWTMDEARAIMGTKISPIPDDVPIKEYPPEVIASVPSDFDSREQWPECETIRTIYNQARCGSCWAFGCIEALQDRFCIHSSPAKNISLSFMDLVTCDRTNDGCGGGEPISAWTYTKTNGIVENDCSPYTIPTCPPAQQPCLDFVNTPKCVQQCQSNSTLSWESDLHYTSSVYAVRSNADQIAAEIMTNGPVETAFTVYEDFLQYKSGIYEHKSGAAVGGHAVKIIGWGFNSTLNMDYWIISNSWTTYWGWDGYFLIRKGVDECGIESGVVAGIPKV